MNPTETNGQDPTEALQIRDLQEANEKLVLTAIRAHELADEAASALAIARLAAQRAERARRAAERATERVEEVLARTEMTARELTEREQELCATGKLREELIGIVGHDLRSPLAAIRTSAEHLSRAGELAEGHASTVRRITRSAERMNRLIAYLIEFTRARLGGGLPIDPGPADLRAICHQVVEALLVASPGRLRCEFEGDLTGIWDSDRLVEAISNILGNALEYAAPETPIVLRAWEDKAWARLEITNQGDPIPADVLPHLFEPFRRGRSREKAQGGHLGLGLYIAHQILFSHGGSLSASSSGGTTTFAMRLLSSPIH